MSGVAAPQATVYSDERALFVHASDLFLCGWRDAPTMVQMRALAEHGARTEKEHGPLALINVAFGGVPTFPDDVRTYAAELTRDAALFQTCRAHVVTIPGFVGAAVGAFINTFMLLGRPPRPTKMFRAVDEAARWVSPQVARRDPQTIVALVAGLRERLYPAGTP